MKTFKKGERVRVLRRAEDYERGWTNVWVGPMDEAIGKVFTVLGDNGAAGVKLDNNHYVEANYNYPRHVLKRVSKKDILDRAIKAGKILDKAGVPRRGRCLRGEGYPLKKSRSSKGRKASLR